MLTIIKSAEMIVNADVARAAIPVPTCKVNRSFCSFILIQFFNFPKFNVGLVFKMLNRFNDVGGFN